MTTNHQIIPPHKLKMHPENMRQHIAPEDAQAMGQSIKENKGVIQALLVVPDPDNDGHYLVVDGNMRLAGGRTLGAHCPPFKCEIISADRAKQLLIMAVTSRHHYPKTPIDEALHYQRLRQDFTIKQIARQVGISIKTVSDRLKLLELPPEVQTLINQGKFSKDARAATAILNINDTTAQIALAKKLASKKGTTVTAIQAAAGRVAQATNKQKNQSKLPSGTVVPIGVFRKFMAQLVVHLKTDADLLEEAAIALSDIDEHLELQALNRAADLRAIITTATGGRYG